ncbi:hypothetical protein JL720_5283 [Aureococcus anophagefferens]|nr:hypothetical protein JL720_5283 [Aureococcus anophagefferens]
MELSETLPKDYEERMVSASVDCAGGKGDGDACHAVGEFFSVIRKDYAAARETYGKNCEARKHGASCFALGRLLLGGRGGAADEARGERAFAAGCDRGHAPACHHLGVLAFKRKDDAAALAHLEKACDGGDAASCYVLGGYFLRPRAATAKAREFLEIACDDGHAPACHNLAVMMKNGDVGVPRDAKLFDVRARTRACCRAGAARRPRARARACPWSYACATGTFESRGESHKKRQDGLIAASMKASMS